MMDIKIVVSLQEEEDGIGIDIKDESINPPENCLNKVLMFKIHEMIKELNEE